MATTIDNLFTMSEIAKLLAVEPHLLTYLLKTRGIEPTAKKAGIRLYTFKQAQHMAVELGVTVPKQVVDSLPDPAAASDAAPTDASPTDCTPQDAGGQLVYDASESQLRSDEDTPPVTGRAPRNPHSETPVRKPRRQSA